jgi:hypothetical protein
MKRTITLCLLALATGCVAGGRVNIVAPEAKVPISLSRGVRDASGQLVPQEQKQVVGQFTYKTRGWSIGWSLVPLTPRRNISEAVNAQVAQAGGDAIINLTTISQGCRLNYFWPFIILPVWPGCTKIELVGDIIKVAPPAAAPADPTAPGYVAPEATP